ncbi:hypothetical protein D0Z08_03205 [Nocardioides immobilis]|uniref:Sensor domain-containing protein n=1 Tax=Nocardioides immobilis TaxID=2049295 RepID=A0A417Y8F9_9ACTN|nr:hypothetical protein [Nocardioides immobilis]RHW28865.1 hypothetical protein D0Z08_03205 [Nocardioides immobilis]
MKVRRSTQHLLAATFAAAALVLAACGDDPSVGDSSASDPVTIPEPSDDPTGTPPASGPTAIPDDFPLTSGWPEDDGSSEYRLTEPSPDNEGMVAAGDLAACDTSADAGDPVDRLTTRLSWGSAGYAREIQLFADPTAAEQFVDSVRDVYRACPTSDQNGTPPTYTTEVNQGALGEHSLVITRVSDGIGRAVIQVVRIGNAVVVDALGDEADPDDFPVIDLATEARENLADVIGATYELQG